MNNKQIILIPPYKNKYKIKNLMIFKKKADFT